MFTGIDEVAWASMKHAYGSAEEVPRLLRGLASPSPQERERALDGMYGAVHHQGDVYDSTLACIPFLFALVARAELPDRSGVVELLVSIGGGATADEQPLEDADPVGERPAEGADPADDNHAMARTAVGAGAAVFAQLVGDRDPEVRRAAAPALTRFLDEPERVLGLLAERLDEEQEDRVRPALAEALGLFARLRPSVGAAAVDRLVALCSAPHDPGLRLAALGQLAGCAPDRLPIDLVSTVVALLRARSRWPRVEDLPERPDTDTLIGRLRRLRPADEEGSQLLRTLHTALGGRTADRIALLNGQLTCDAATDRCNAVWMSAGLFCEWRGSYEEPVALIGEQLLLGDGRLRDAAVSVLGDLFTLARPAADHLAELVATGPEHSTRRWERGAPTLGGALKALARAGDRRAVPALAEVLGGPVVPYDAGYTIKYLGAAAEPLGPLLRARLGEVPLDSPDAYDHASPLLSALGGLRHTDALPEVLRLLRGMTAELRGRERLVKAATQTLGAFGPAAREALPVLRELLDGEYAVAAASALWSVEGDAGAVLPVLRRELTRGKHARASAEALGRLGPAAGAAVPDLRRMAASEDVWKQAAAAGALWDVAGEPDPVLTALRSAWGRNVHTRGTLAACLGRMGPAGTPAHALLRTELAAPRRHQARSAGHGSHDIVEDEQLLRLCRTALESARPGPRQATFAPPRGPARTLAAPEGSDEPC
ncbi:HEAT repeat domain-containing protein [Streptomyces sp. NBC_01571]|uniref:HEAT repeat domain-containing protein n=1 Tax=Streptomyces sp. NBC_01571 TaxID=2975883 RepID=UPI00225016D1|nr:HEAT repeat domain-containing protein [Streptomyces sp. NBC_01571]MCX4572873.1 HEAT repeat domain-containing protein [Streptomyces sp. NBC_01571]